MQRTYLINHDETIITIRVTISTPGFAVTRIFKLPPGGPRGTIADSPVDGIGDVPETNIDRAENLEGFIIETDTIIKLENIVPSEQWQTCFDNLVCMYEFTGGGDGVRVFDCEEDDKSQSTSKATIVVSKKILFTTNNVL